MTGGVIECDCKLHNHDCQACKMGADDQALQSRERRCMFESAGIS